MGFFDTVVVGTRRGQVKCFGRGMRTLGIGDVLSLHRPFAVDVRLARLESATRDEAPGLVADLAVGEPSALRDYQVVMIDGAGSESHLIVRGGVLVDWQDEPASDLPRVGNRGQPFEESAGRAGIELPEL